MVKYLFLLQCYKNYENRSKNARVIIENKVAHFSGHGVDTLIWTILLLELFYEQSNR